MLRRAVAAQLLEQRLRRRPQPRRALQALGEDALSVAVQDVDGLAALDARMPVGVVGDPVVAGEEDRLRDHDAADLVVLGTGEEGAPRAAADRLDARRHLGERVGAVQVAEGLPGEPHRHALVAREEAVAGDGPVGRAETEEERRTRRNRPEAVRRGLPEVDLVRRLGAVQEVGEPAEVGVGDEGGGGDGWRHRLARPVHPPVRVTMCEWYCRGASEVPPLARGPSQPDPSRPEPRIAP